MSKFPKFCARTAAVILYILGLWCTSHVAIDLFRAFQGSAEAGWQFEFYILAVPILFTAIALGLWRLGGSIAILPKILAAIGVLAPIAIGFTITAQFY
jgi:hypothetical protein